jgi:hypothetical protein
MHVKGVNQMEGLRTHDQPESVCYKVLIRLARCLHRARYSDMFLSSKQLRRQTKVLEPWP